MSADPDDLEIAEQEGYDKGRKVGFNEGIKHAAMVAMNLAGEHFKNGNDDLAATMRDHYSRVRIEIHKDDEK